MGLTDLLSDGTPGGIWSSSNTLIATVGTYTRHSDSSSVLAQTTISYTLSTG
jgi:hypothetical protein